MSADSTSAEQARRQRKRFQQAGEPLSENSSLRDGLNDEQAQQLLEWGLEQLQHEAARTAALSDEDALPLMEACADTVRQIMRQVNKLVDSLPQASAAESWEELLKLSQRLRQLQTSPEEKMETAREAFALSAIRAELDRDTIFTYLMDMLQRDEPA